MTACSVYRKHNLTLYGKVPTTVPHLIVSRFAKPGADESCHQFTPTFFHRARAILPYPSSVGVLNQLRS